MRRRSFLAAWLVFSTLGAVPSGAAEKTPADKADAERIVGKWVLKESDRPNPIFNADGSSVELTFEEMKFEFAVLKDGGRILHIPGTFFLDDKQTPKLLDITLS